jgi:hypothetical protein
MKVSINIDDYVTDAEKKQLCIDYINETLRGNDEYDKERILYNMAYMASYKILDDALTHDMMEMIKQKAVEIISNFSSYDIFRKRSQWETEDSVAYTEIQNAVREHKHLISPLVKKAIIEHDYSKDLPDSPECIGDCIIDAIKKGLNQQ